MSLLNSTDFKTLFTEFDDKSDAVIDLQISQAKNDVSQSIFKSKYEIAILTLVAHEFTYDTYAAEGDEFLGKELSAFSAGGASHSFKTSSDDADSDYKSTVYGRKFIAIRNRCNFSMGAI